MSQDFKDLFSGHAADYAKFRPTYPPQLFEYFAKIAPSKASAWDCGTGNGQAAVALAEQFERVIATDPGEGQIEKAIPHPRVEYQVMAAETAKFPEKSFDFIGVAQAFHWFRHDEFFRVVKKVSKPNAILAVWSYSFCKISPKVDPIVHRLYEDILKDQWEGERKYVETFYSTIPVPFEEVKAPEFVMSANWSLSQFSGYLNTWSALKTLRKKTGRDGFKEIAFDLRSAWGKSPELPVEWELKPRVFKIK